MERPNFLTAWLAFSLREREANMLLTVLPVSRADAHACADRFSAAKQAAIDDLGILRKICVIGKSFPYL
jgi:hypothetical protein